MFETANYIEAGLWLIIGLLFLVCALRGRCNCRAAGLAAITFALFGVSDVVEVQTGAWWRPCRAIARQSAWPHRARLRCS